MKFFIIVSALFALAASSSVQLSLEQIDSALQNPNLNPALRPVLEAALNQIMDSLWNGEALESVVVDLPLDADNGILIPEPSPLPVDDEKPISDSDVNSAAGPLVQIIVNVNNEQAFEDGPVEVAYNPEENILNPVDVILN